MLYDVLSVVWATLTADVIYMLGYSSVLTLLFPKFFRKPVIVNVDGLEWTRAKFGRVLRYVYHAFEILNARIVDRIVVDSRSIGAYYRRVYGLDATYVPNGISQIAPLDPTALRRFGLEANGYYLVIARLVPENNVDLIIDGFERVCTGKKLVIVGPLDRTKSSKDYVERLVSHRNDRVVFLGGIYDLHLQRTLRHNCFAYIHGHDRGGTNPSLVEALSCGNRMLVIESPFNREVARDAAEYFKKDSADLARKMELIERTSFNRAKRARTIYEENYTAEQAAETFARLVTSMLEELR
jgi:glycosyltransferase involved in cell wall biosynthesis